MANYDGSLKFDTAIDSKGFDSGISKLTSAAAAGAAAITAALAAAATAAVNLGMGFESALSGIKAVSGATESEMEKLRDAAIKAGEDTVFSASESAKAIEELLKAGLSVEQVLGGGLAGALELASAGEIGLADAAEVASTVLNAFRDDALSVSDAANTLAGAANASATDVRGLQLGLQASSAVAAGMGMTFEDTAAALAVFAQNGLKSSDAGTSLKTMLMNLQPTTDKQIVQFKMLGLLTEQGASAFYDLNGSMKPLNEIAGLLQNSMLHLTDAERAMALEVMFGSDAIRAGNILYREGAEGIDSMVEAMRGIKAADVAAERLNNLAGDVEFLGGSLETLGIQIYESFQEPLREAAQAGAESVEALSKELRKPDMQESISKIASAFSDLIGSASELAGDAIPVLVSAIGFLIDHCAVLLAVLIGIIAAINTYKAVTVVISIIEAYAKAVGIQTNAVYLAEAAQWAWNAAVAANPAVLAALAVGVLVAAIGLLIVASNDVSDAHQQLLDKNQDLTRSIEDVRAANDDLIESQEEIKRQFDDAVKATEAQAEHARKLVSEITALSAVESKSAAEKLRMKTAIDQLNSIYPELNLLIDEEGNLIGDAIDSIHEYIDAQAARQDQMAMEERAAESLDLLVEAERKLVEAEVERTYSSQRLSEEIARKTELESLYAQALDGAVISTSNLTAEEMEWLGIQGEAELSLTNLGDLMQNLDESTAMTSNKLEEQSGVIDTLQASVNTARGEYEGFAEEMSAQAETVDETTRRYEEAAGRQAEILAERQAAEQEYTLMLTEEANARNMTLDEYIDAEKARAEAEKELLKEKEEALKSYTEFATNAFSELQEGAATSLEDMIQNMQDHQDAMKQWADDLETLSKMGVDEGIIKTLREGGPESAAQARKLVEEIDGASEEKLKELNDTYQAGIKLARETVATEFGNPAWVDSANTTINDMGTAVSNNNALNEAVSGQVAAARTTASTEVGIQNFPSVGEDIAKGIADGIRSGQSYVSSAMQDLIAAAESAARAAADSHSPARRFMPLGEDIDAGIAQGLDISSYSAEAMHDLVARAENAAWDMQGRMSTYHGGTSTTNNVTEGSETVINVDVGGIEAPMNDETDYREVGRVLGEEIDKELRWRGVLSV